MDTTKLIEEAERLSERATPGPWGFDSFGVHNWPGREQPPRLMELLHNEHTNGAQNTSDSEFIARARTLVPDLAAALKASEERARKAEDLLLAEIRRLATEAENWKCRAQGWESEATIATERFNRLAADDKRRAE